MQMSDKARVHRRNASMRSSRPRPPYFPPRVPAEQIFATPVTPTSGLPGYPPGSVATIPKPAPYLRFQSTPATTYIRWADRNFLPSQARGHHAILHPGDTFPPDGLYYL